MNSDVFWKNVEIERLMSYTDVAVRQGERQRERGRSVARERIRKTEEKLRKRKKKTRQGKGGRYIRTDDDDALHGTIKFLGVLHGYGGEMDRWMIGSTTVTDICVESYFSDCVAAEKAGRWVQDD